MTLGSPEWRRGAVWSGAQLGIYRDLQDPEDSGGRAGGRGRRDAWRLRCCLATAAVALAALIVSIALVDVAGSGSMVQLHKHSSQTSGGPARRTQGATATATPAPPRAAGGRQEDGEPAAATTSTAEAEKPAERRDGLPLQRSSHHRSYHSHRRFRDGRSQQLHCSGDCDEGRQLASPAEGSLQQEHSTRLRSRHRKGGHRQDVRFPESDSGGESVQYAQLAGYKFSGGPNSIQDVIRYLTEGQPEGRPHRPQPRGRPRQHVRFPEGGAGPRATAVRFSGVYSMSRPGAHRHQGTAPGNEPETGGSHDRLTVTLPPPPLNGHAYIADPFVNFRPEDPSQINLLASSGLRFALPARSLDKVSQWRFPQTHPARQPVRQPTQTQSQLYTEVVYHPLGHRPPPPQDQQQQGIRGAVRPYSLMLDVYPLTAEGKTQYRPPPPRPRPSGSAPHMVVHLNLYPRAGAAGGRHDQHDRSDEFDYAEADPTQEDVDSRKENAVTENTLEAFVSSPVVFCNKTMDVILRLKDLEKPLDRVSQGNQSDTKDDTDTRQGPTAEESLPLDPREASSEISGEEETDDQVEGDDGGDYSATQQVTTHREEEAGPPTNGHQSHSGPGADEGSADYDIALDSGPPRSEEDYVSAVGYFGGLQSRYQTQDRDDLGEESDVDRSAESQMTGPETADGTQY